jgi:drug/metabolite transporter (DMT)-like permease
MLRGTLVLFAGAFTVLILRRQLFIHHWLGMVLITAGAALVGASSVIYQDAPPDANIVAPWQLAAGAHGSGGWNASAAPGLHYAPGVSRLASRGMLSAAALGGRAQQQQPPHHSSGGRLDLATASAAASASAAPLFGDLLVVCAQAFTALQFILEERYLVRYKVWTHT